MKDPFRFLLTGIFGITFDRTTEICLSDFDKPVHCLASLMKGIRKRKSDSLWLARFDRKFLGHSHIWSTPRVINAILGHYARFWIFWRGSFGARKQRLAAQGSRLGLAGSQNSLPPGQLASELENTFNSEFSYVLQPPSGKWIRGPSSKEAGCLIDVNNSSHRILITGCLIVCRWIGDPWVEVRLYFVHLTYSGTTRQQPAKMWQNAYSRWTLTMLGQHSASVISIWWQKTLYVSHRPMPI